MNWTVLEENLIDKNNKKHAGGKAREDLFNILIEYGFSEIIIKCPQEERENANAIKKLSYHYKIRKEWDRVLSGLRPNDNLVLQFPVINQTLLFSGVLRKVKRRGVRIYAFIHDLNYLRFSSQSKLSWKQKLRIRTEELKELRDFDAIVVHNDAMKERICSQLGIEDNKVITLKLFDYLLPTDSLPSRSEETYKSCIIAGNLSVDKAGYVYSLPTAPAFELYGVNFEPETLSDNVHYHGSFLPEELPKHLTGGFGLVWDGNSADTCGGAWGEYLRYNNPHKTSLYLACGIPVIVWEESALKEFVLTHKVGIAVSSLHQIESSLSEISSTDYDEMKENAIELSKQLRSGFYTITALEALGIKRLK